MKIKAITNEKPVIKKFMRVAIDKPNKPNQILLHGKQSKNSINYFAWNDEN